MLTQMELTLEPILMLCQILILLLALVIGQLKTKTKFILFYSMLFLTKLIFVEVVKSNLRSPEGTCMLSASPPGTLGTT